MTVPQPPRLNLVCHGMMLFVYLRDLKDFFEIWVPKPPTRTSGSSTEDLHQISLTRTLGEFDYKADGTGNLLKSSQKNYERGVYELRLFGAEPFTRDYSEFCNPKTGRQTPDPTKNIVFYDKSKGGHLISQFNPGNLAASPIWFRIKIPYPSNVYRFRPQRFPNKNPYEASGDTVSAFKIAPDEMAGINVFSYKQVTPASVELRRDLGSGKYESQAVGFTGDSLNLHLYSEEPDAASLPRPMENHIQQFNNMAKVEYDGQTFPLDLAVTDKLVVLNPHSPPTPIDVDLKLRDIQSLIEVRTDERTEEPVECLQGWGT